MLANNRKYTTKILIDAVQIAVTQHLITQRIIAILAFKFGTFMENQDA